MPSCSVCAHASRLEIDKRLAVGEGSQRVIARQFGISHDSVRRHALKHLDEALVLASEQSREEVAQEALEHCRWLVENARKQADRVLQRAEGLKDIVCPSCGQRPNPFREWIDPLNRAVQNLGRFTGEINNDPVAALLVMLGAPSQEALKQAWEHSRAGKEITPEEAIHDALEVLKMLLPQAPQLAYHARQVIQRECEAVGMLEPHVNGGANGHGGS